jgi:hypothetical protein
MRKVFDAEKDGLKRCIDAEGKYLENDSFHIDFDFPRTKLHRAPGLNACPVHHAIHGIMNIIDSLLEVESASRIEFHFILAMSILFLDTRGQLSRDFRESCSSCCANAARFDS